MLDDVGMVERPGRFTAWAETGWDEFVPDLHHIDRNILLLNDSSVLAMIEIPAYPFQLEGVDIRNTRRDQFDKLYMIMADTNVTISTHLVHLRDRTPPPLGRFISPVIRDLFESYRLNCLSGQTFTNKWYLTITVAPRFLPKQMLRQYLPFLAKPKPEESEGIVRQLRSILRAIMPYLSQNGARILGYEDGDVQGVLYSRVAQARRSLLYGRDEPIPVFLDEPCPLGAAIYNERVVCGSRAIRIHGMDGYRYAKILGFLRYPTKTKTGQFAHLLKMQSDFVLSQSFRFASRAASEISIYRASTSLHNAGAVQARAMERLEDAHEDVQSGEVVRGSHNFGLMVFAPDLVALDASMGEAANAINKAAATPVNEDSNAFAAYWTTLPGTAEWLQGRAGDITTKNFTALSEFNGYPTGQTSGPWGRSLVQFKTSANTTFHWQPHVGLVGHTLFLGKIRSGKTLLMNALLASLDQVNARVVYFDRDHCAEPMIRATGGTYLALRSGEPSGLSPLRALANTKEDREFLVQWILALMQLDGAGHTKPETVKRLARGVSRQLKLPPHQRSLGGLRAFLGHEEGGDGPRLDVWCHDGANGWLFDGPNDEVSMDGRMTGFDMTKLLEHYACPAIAAYLIHRVRPLIDGRPIVVACPEARFYLLSPLFASIIEDFALGLAKKNGALWMDTQEPAHILGSSVGASLVSQCASIFQYPTRTADENDYINRLGFSPAMVKAITEEMPVLPFRNVLLRREDESVILNVEMTNMDDEITLLSGTETTTRLIPGILEKVGNDPDAFRREFLRQARAAKLEAAA